VGGNKAVGEAYSFFNILYCMPALYFNGKEKLKLLSGPPLFFSCGNFLDKNLLLGFIGYGLN
jgi:hypothetical protein